MADTYHLVGDTASEKATAKLLGGIQVLASPVIELKGHVVNDIFECIRVPNGAAVLAVSLQIIERSSVNDSAVTIGDGSTADGYLAATKVDHDAAAYANGAGAFLAEATHGGRLIKFVGDTDTIDLKISTCASSPTAGKLRVYALVAQMAHSAVATS